MLDKDKRVAKRAANKAGRASAEGKTKLGRTLNWKKEKSAARKAKRKGTTPVATKKVVKKDTPKSGVMTKPYEKPTKVVKQKHASPGGKSGETKRKTGMTYRTSWDANKSGVQAKYKDKGGYAAYKKDAEKWNTTNDAKKAAKKTSTKIAEGRKDGAEIMSKTRNPKPGPNVYKGGGTVKKKYSDGGRIQHD